MVVGVSSRLVGRLRLRCAAGVRPTKGVVRQAVCDMLRPWLAGRLCIDLFAGSGAVGITALAAGAAGCIFVEWERRALVALQANLIILRRNFAPVDDAAAKIVLCRQSVADFLRRYETEEQVFVWADPPWAETAWRQQLLLHLRVGRGSYLVIESQLMAAGEVQLPVATGWVLRKRKTYGRTTVEILCKE